MLNCATQSLTYSQQLIRRTSAPHIAKDRVMARMFSVLALVALTLQIPARGHASSYERSKIESPVTRMQKGWVYRLVYIVDDRGRWILVRSDGTREERLPRSPHRTRK